MLGCAFKSLTDRLTDKPLLECVEGSCEVYESVRNMLHALKKESLKMQKKVMQKYVKYALRVKLMLCLNSVLITFKLQTMADQIPGSLCSIKLSPFTFSWDFIFSNRI